MQAGAQQILSISGTAARPGGLALGAVQCKSWQHQAERRLQVSAYRSAAGGEGCTVPLCQQGQDEGHGRPPKLEGQAEGLQKTSPGNLQPRRLQ